MAKADKSIDMLKLLRGDHKEKPPADNDGLRIIKVSTTDPDPITFVFEGSKQQLDLDIFEIPIDFYPLRAEDRLLVFPIVGGARWAAIQKIDSGIVLATMASATSLTIEGISKTYGAADLVIPPYFAVDHVETKYSDSYTGKESDNYLRGDNLVIRPLKAGDQVSIAPTWDKAAEKIKYVILEKY